MAKRGKSPNNLLGNKDHSQDLSASLTLGDGLSSSFDQLDHHDESHESPGIIKLRPIVPNGESEEAERAKAKQKVSSRGLKRIVTWQAQEEETETDIKPHKHCVAKNCQIEEEVFEDFEDVSPMHAKFRICKRARNKCDHQNNDGRTPMLTRLVRKPTRDDASDRSVAMSRMTKKSQLFSHTSTVRDAIQELSAD